MRLHVGVLRAEELLRPISRQVLDDIRILAAAVVPLARISFGVLVGEHRARRFQHGFADKVLRSNQFKSFMLAASFVVDGSGNLRIALEKRAVHLCGVVHVIFLIPIWPVQQAAPCILNRRLTKGSKQRTRMSESSFPS